MESSCVIPIIPIDRGEKLIKFESFKIDQNSAESQNNIETTVAKNIHHENNDLIKQMGNTSIPNPIDEKSTSINTTVPIKIDHIVKILIVGFHITYIKLI